MNLTTEERSVLKAQKYYPSVSVILPFDVKVSLKEELQHQLKLASDEVRRQLRENYAEEIVLPVLEKLEAQVGNVDFSSDRKSIAIFVSPVLAKTFYLDVAVEPKIILDESFEIRDLIYAKQATFKYLVLLLSGKHAKLFLGSNHHLVKLRLESASHSAAYDKDLAERVLNFSDPDDVRDNLIEKFVRHTDDGIDAAVRSYGLPLFVVAPQRIGSEFRRISRHKIDGLVFGNYDDASTSDIVAAVAPELDKWQAEKTAGILGRLQDAMKAKKLICGVSGIWGAAKDKMGRLLVVEKNFQVAADHTDSAHFIRRHNGDQGDGLYIKDAVDDIIEMVLAGGGEVVFVEDGALNEFLHIALVTYY
jgi:hypothetical protein